MNRLQDQLSVILEHGLTSGEALEMPGFDGYIFISLRN